MFKIQLARLGQTMEQGTLVRWLKKEGDIVELGEELYEIETEKAIVPVQATRRGRLVKVVAAEGANVPVGAVLAVAAEPDEQIREGEVEAFVRGDAGQPASAGTAAPGGAAASGSPASTAPAVAGRVAAHPKARALARELGVDLADLQGSGPDGVVTADDVRNAASRRSGASDSAATPLGVGRTAPLSAVQRSTIAALDRGWRTPQFTQATIVDATALARRRGDDAGAFSYLDYFLEAVLAAARQVPEAAARIQGEEICYLSRLDLSIATATGRGLLVPVLRDAGAMRMSERRRAWQALVQRARDGIITPDEMSGGVIAVSNLGARGVDYGTALLPADHAAIVFFGAIEPRAVVVEGRIEARPTVHVSITYDHRIVDGVLASRFTSALKTALESPAAAG